MQRMNGSPPECLAEIDVGKAQLHIDAITPHTVRMRGTLLLRVRNLPVNVDSVLVGDINLGVGAGQCDGGSPNFTWRAFPLEVILPLVRETISPRDGYTKVDVEGAIINPDIRPTDIRICKDCGFASPACNAL